MSASVTSDKGFYGWINLAVTAVMGMVAPLYLISFGYFLPSLVDDGWDRSWASGAATINLIVMGLCGPLAGAFIMKYGAKRAIVTGNIVGAIGFVILSFHWHLWELYLAYGVLIGIGSGFGGLLSSTTVLNNWFIKRRSLALGIFLGSGGLGGIFIGPAMMNYIRTRGWRPAYLVIAGAAFLLLVVLPALLLRNKPQDLGQVADGSVQSKSPATSRPGPRKAVYKTPVDFTAKEALHTRCLWILIAYFCLSMLAMQGLMTHMIAHLKDIGIASVLAAFCLSVMTGVMTFAQFAAGFVGMRFSMLSIAVSGEVLKLIGVLILVSTASVPVVLVSMVFLGMGFGATMVATMNIFPNYFGLANYPKIMGYTRLFWAFIGGAGAPLAAYIRETTGSYLPAFRLALAVFAAGLICLVFAKPPVHPSLKKHEPVDAVPAVS
jgi:MFS family permease